MKKTILKLTAMVLLIALLCFTAWYGLDLGFFSIPSARDTDNGIRLGLDLVGGSIITFEANVDGDITEDELRAGMDNVEAMLRARLTDLGLSEAVIYQAGDKRITVEIPAVSDPEEAVQKLGSTAQLEFRDADENVILVGTDVVKSEYRYGPIDSTGMNQSYVLLTLTEEGAAKFTEATKAAANRDDDNNYIKIMLDEAVVSQPYVDKTRFAQTGITGSEVVITGGGSGFTAEDAGWLANVIAAGQLPFSLSQVELRSVGAQLGMKALETSLWAGLIGICLVIAFMIIFYRLPGVVASVALVFYVAIEAVILAAFHVNLSLPGIAGIILSIGMAVDANVIIFERIKEELRAGKTVRSAIDSGFHRAFAAIIDSNVTTLIAAVVLYTLGSGTIVGFALTLGLGIVVSMFTALTVTRFLLNRLVELKITNNALYGVRKRREA